MIKYLSVCYLFVSVLALANESLYVQQKSSYNLIINLGNEKKVINDFFSNKQNKNISLSNFNGTDAILFSSQASSKTETYFVFDKDAPLDIDCIFSSSESVTFSPIKKSICGLNIPIDNDIVDEQYKILEKLPYHEPNENDFSDLIRNSTPVYIEVVLINDISVLLYFNSIDSIVDRNFSLVIRKDEKSYDFGKIDFFINYIKNGSYTAESISIYDNKLNYISENLNYTELLEKLM